MNITQAPSFVTYAFEMLRVFVPPPHYVLFKLSHSSIILSSRLRRHVRIACDHLKEEPHIYILATPPGNIGV